MAESGRRRLGLCLRSPIGKRSDDTVAGVLQKTRDCLHQASRLRFTPNFVRAACVIVAIPFFTTACDEAPSGPDSWPEVSGPSLRVDPQYKTWATDIWRPISGVDAPVAVYWIDNDTVLLPGYRKGFREEDNPFALFTWRLGNEPVELARVLPAKPTVTDASQKDGKPTFWDGDDFCAGMGRIRYGLEVEKRKLGSFMIGPPGHLQKRSFVKEVRDFLASNSGENWGQAVSPFDCDLVFRKGMAGRDWTPLPDGSGYIDLGRFGSADGSVSVVIDVNTVIFKDVMGNITMSPDSFKYYEHMPGVVISAYTRGGRFLRGSGGCSGFGYLKNFTDFVVECFPDGPWRLGGVAGVIRGGFLISAEDYSTDTVISSIFKVDKKSGKYEIIGIGHVFGIWTSPDGCRAVIAGFCKNDNKCSKLNNSVVYHVAEICASKDNGDV